MPMDGDLYKPAVPAKVRDIAYWIGFAVGGLGLLTTGLVAIWAPDAAQQITATVLVIGGAASWVSSGLGVVYRPGAQPPTGKHAI